MGVQIREEKTTKGKQRDIRQVENRERRGTKART